MEGKEKVMITEMAMTVVVAEVVIEKVTKEAAVVIEETGEETEMTMTVMKVEAIPEEVETPEREGIEGTEPDL